MVVFFVNGEKQIIIEIIIILFQCQANFGNGKISLKALKNS